MTEIIAYIAYIVMGTMVISGLGMLYCLLMAILVAKE